MLWFNSQLLSPQFVDISNYINITLHDGECVLLSNKPFLKVDATGCTAGSHLIARSNSELGLHYR